MCVCVCLFFKVPRHVRETSTNMIYAPIRNMGEEQATAKHHPPWHRFCFSLGAVSEIERCIEGASSAVAFPERFRVQQCCIMSKTWHGSQWHIC